MPKLPVMPATDPMLTIEPPPDSLISGAQVWMPLRVPVTLISKILFHSSMSTLGNRTRALLPTMFMRTCSAACLLLDLGDGGVPLILFHHIELYEVGFAAGFIDLRGQGVAALLVAAGDEHGRALFGEQSGRRAAHAAVATGDQRHLVLKPHRRLLRRVPALVSGPARSRSPYTKKSTAGEFSAVVEYDPLGANLANQHPPRRRAGNSGTRDAILDAAISLFSERGYESSSMRAIAAGAGVDPALIRHFFSDKETLFATAIADRTPIFEQLAASLAGIPPASERASRPPTSDSGSNRKPVTSCWRSPGRQRPQTRSRRCCETPSPTTSVHGPPRPTATKPDGWPSRVATFRTRDRAPHHQGASDHTTPTRRPHSAGSAHDRAYLTGTHL